MRIRNQLEKGILNPFIHYIRFPQYRNLKKDTKIEFTYPLTVITGENGSNKSSIIRALYGSPKGRSAGTYWFATSIDPIPEGKGEPSCYIYGYSEKGNDILEVLKTRVKRYKKATSEGEENREEENRDPDYFETSRPLRRYKMIPPPPPKQRNSPVEKSVLYLDFRHNMSAFDKYYYSSDSNDIVGLNKRKNLIKKRSEKLKKAIEFKGNSFIWYHERIIDKCSMYLDDNTTYEISSIMGKSYSRIYIIKHKFFPTDGYTVVLFSGDSQYSEAFAGSGEYAIVMAVWHINSSPEKSLILLDEPEVSLHPGAQKGFLKFLKKSITQKHHQVILATHSPEFLKGLPNDAIKSLVVDKVTGDVGLPFQSVTPEEAFQPMGYSTQWKKKVLVEDDISQAIIEVSLKKLKRESIMEQMVIKVAGGKNDIYNKIPYEISEGTKHTLMILDGDVRENWAIDLERVSDKELENFMYKTIGKNVAERLPPGGECSKDEKISKWKKIVQWGNKCIHYLPGTLPEILIISKILEEDVCDEKEMIQDAMKELKIETLESIKAKEAKKLLRYITMRMFSLDEPSQSSQTFCARQMLTKISDKWSVWEDVYRIIESFLEECNHGTTH